MKIHTLQRNLVKTMVINNIQTNFQFDISTLNTVLYLFTFVNNDDKDEILREKIIVR